MSDNQNTNSGTPENSGKPNKPQGINKPKFNGYWIYIAIAIFFIGITFFNSSEKVKEVDWNQFSALITEQKVRKLVF